MKRVVHAACPHDCPDACSVLITVESVNGPGSPTRATKIQGDPSHPVTRGFLCAKVAKYLDRVYSADRVLYPLRRVGAKGANTGDWRRISWDEALDEIATRFAAISREFGSEAILPYSYGGTLGVLGNASMDRRFFHRLGASQLDRTICASTGGEALISVVGRKLGTEPEQFAHSRTIIAWGANIHGNNVHLWPFIEEARRKGARLIVIDPYRTRTARCADWYLPIHPGTDAALAMGMMHVIIGEDLYDKDYVSRATIGFDALRERVRDFTPDRVAAWTGIATADIVKLAREYATARPAAIRVNYGVQRAENGGMAMRAIVMLPCITGSWKEVGGGLQLSTSQGVPINAAALERPDLMDRSPKRGATRVINMSRLGEALTEIANPPVHALFVYNSNPAAVAPDHNRVVAGLLRPDLFTVVHDQFLTDTCDYADIVLPATTFFEQKELQKGYGHYFVALSQQAIAPLGECRSNVELFRALALRMGFDDDVFHESVDDMIDLALAGIGDDRQAWVDGITRERLETVNFLRLNFGSSRPPDERSEVGALPETDVSGEVGLPRSARDLKKEPFLPFAEGKFPTPSGKAELYSEKLKALGLDPVVSFTPPTESRHAPAAQRFPLELLARKSDNFLNTTFHNVASVQAMERTDLLELSTGDATPRGIAEGDRVRVFNDRGSVVLTAHVNGAVQAGVVGAHLNWAKLAGGQSINVLTSQRLTDFGGGATFYSCLVEVERVT
jgi:anaerobic selenocysteine-containing dehydrogenase